MKVLYYVVFIFSLLLAILVIADQTKEAFGMEYMTIICEFEDRYQQMDIPILSDWTEEQQDAVGEHVCSSISEKLKCGDEENE